MLSTASYSSSNYQTPKYRTVAPNRAWYALFKKELRQILLLTGLLILLGVLISFLLLLGDRNQLANLGMGLTPFLVLPMLYAAGAPPTLIGQEKDSRTLLWLTSLPIKPSQIVTSKIVAILIGFAIVVAASLGLSAFLDSSRLRDSFQTIRPYTNLWGPEVLLVQTMFLFIGIATAWISRSPWWAIGYQVVLLIAAFIAGEIAYTILSGDTSGARFTNTHAGAYKLIINTLTFIVIMAALISLGWNQAKQSFRQNDLTTPYATIPAEILEQVNDHNYAARGSRFNKLPFTPDTALLWQAYKQNNIGNWFLGFLILSLLAWAYGNSTSAGPYRAEAISPFSSLTLGISLFLISCMGVAAFASDVVRKRIQFLADRGLRPWTIWWTRLTPSLAYIVIAVVIIFIALRVGIANFIPIDFRYHSMVDFQAYDPSRDPTNYYILLGIAICGFTAFGYAQWTSQVLKSPILSFCLAPVVIAGVYLYSFFIAISITFEKLWLLPILCVPFIATAVMTRRWMDGDYTLRTMLKHAGLLSLVLLVPLTPLFYGIATTPSQTAKMDREVKASKLGSEKSVSLPMPASFKASPLDQKSENKLNTILIQSLGSHENTLMQVEQDVRKHIYSVATRAKFNFNTSKDTPDFKTVYTGAFDLLSTLTYQDRRNPKLLLQEYADRAEAWIAYELGKQEVASLVGQENLKKWISRIPSTEKRNEVRRRAIANFYVDHLNNKDDGFLFATQIPPGYGLLTNRILIKRELSVVADNLFKYLDSKEYRSGSAFDQYQNTWTLNLPIVSDAISLNSNNVIGIPGLLWHGDWEEYAEKLRK